MKGRKPPTRPKLFIIADAAVDTGFAQVTHNIVDNLYKAWDITILAINYYGDPHPVQSKASLWNPAGAVHGDLYGFSRVQPLLEQVQPDIVLVIQDPWIASQYVEYFKKTPGKKVLYTPVDAKNIKQMYVDEINKGYDRVVGYTQFGVDELLEAGLTVKTSVVPHGVDTTMYFPLDKNEVRERAGIDPKFFIVQMVDRNQKRKRIDLGLYYFSEWVKRTNKPENVKFYYHGALRDEGWDIGQLCVYLGIKDRLVLSHENLSPSRGFPIEAMKLVYNLADIKLSMANEGWGLTTMESMACGIPNVAPRYSALGEWANNGVEYLDISNIPYFTTNGINTMSGIPTLESTLEILERLYTSKQERDTLGKKGFDLINQEQFRWKNIAKKFERIFFDVIEQGIDDE